MDGLPLLPAPELQDEGGGVKRDPRVRPDGLCAQCGGPRPERPENAYASQAQYDVDPFCSASCAKQWHGVHPGKGVCSIYPQEQAA